MYTPDTCLAMLITWYRHRYLPCYTYYLIFDTDTCYAILIIWYLIPILTMLYLLFDIWYRYLSCYTYYLISDTGTCHSILIACYLTPDIITLDTWHAITRYWFTWPDIVEHVLYCIFMTITFTGTWHDYYTLSNRYYAGYV